MSIRYSKFCCYCGVYLTKITFSREHVLPKSRGGSNKAKNKLGCCKKCNQEKGAMTLDEYITWLAENKPPNWSFKQLMCTQLLGKY